MYYSLIFRYLACRKLSVHFRDKVELKCLCAVFLPLATKLGQGYVFTCVCDFVHGWVVFQHALQTVSQQVSRGDFKPTPKREVEGSGLGKGGLQAHTWGGL